MSEQIEEVSCDEHILIGRITTSNEEFNNYKKLQPSIPIELTTVDFDFGILAGVKGESRFTPTHRVPLLTSMGEKYSVPVYWVRVPNTTTYELWGCIDATQSSRFNSKQFIENFGRGAFTFKPIYLLHHDVNASLIGMHVKYAAWFNEEVSVPEIDVLDKLHLLKYTEELLDFARWMTGAYDFASLDYFVKNRHLLNNPPFTPASENNKEEIDNVK
ncbi:MAG: hypothetical protein IBX57_00490 [Gammaproteobacteria bacterium]|nr:hypothetical protein [Gammaproteobacteria bacterium]